MDEDITHFSDRHPPKNRKETGLKVIEIEIVGLDKTTRTDPNGALMAIAELPKKGLPFGEPNPATPSEFSGQPGYLYRTSEIELALDTGELIGLLSRDLKPAQFKAITERYGIFFDTHDDFYDVRTGEALQPLRFRATLKPR